MNYLSIKRMCFSLVLFASTSAFAAQPNYLCTGVDFEPGDINSDYTYTLKRLPGGRYVMISEIGDRTTLFPSEHEQGLWVTEYGGNDIRSTRLEVETNGNATLYAPAYGAVDFTVAYSCEVVR